MFKIFTLIAAVGLLIGIFVHDPVIKGAGKAFFGVFFILMFMVKLADYWTAEKPETTHDHGGLMGKGGHGHH